MPNKNIALYEEWKIQFEKTFEYLKGGKKTQTPEKKQVSLMES